MSRTDFIEDLVKLLVKIERGMLEFDEPLPISVGDNILRAVVGFGREVVPILHRVLGELDYSEMSHGYLIDALGEIGDPDSTPYLIECHKRGSYQTSAAAMEALRKLKTEDGYKYMGKALIAWMDGDKRAFNSGLEIVIACKALGEWNDVRAIPPL